MIDTFKLLRPKANPLDHNPRVFMFNRHRTKRLNTPYTLAMQVLFEGHMHVFVKAQVINGRVVAMKKIEEQNW